MRVFAPLAALCALIVCHQGKPGRPSLLAYGAAVLILGAAFRLWAWPF